MNQTRRVESPLFSNGAVVRLETADLRGMFADAAISNELSYAGRGFAVLLATVRTWTPRATLVGIGALQVIAILETFGNLVTVERLLTAGDTLHRTEACVLRAGEIGEIASRTSAAFRVLVVEIDSFAPLADERGNPEGAAAGEVSEGAHIVPLRRLIAAECERHNEGSAAYLEALVAALVGRPEEQARTALPAMVLPPRMLRHVAARARENLGAALQVRDLAAFVDLSPSHFSRLFKNSTGVSPHNWLMQERCELAKRLLCGGDLSLAEVALEVGCCDQAHLTRLFKRVVGKSPGHWRREMQSLLSDDD